ncbi:hypothetical protein DFP73DRAFT_600349 [Morchella snyderi]|nr:hypothetical protein DFP73DRAFT_600349 [Morchella snyderi]
MWDFISCGIANIFISKLTASARRSWRSWRSGRSVGKPPLQRNHPRGGNASAPSALATPSSARLKTEVEAGTEPEVVMLESVDFNSEAGAANVFGDRHRILLGNFNTKGQLWDSSPEPVREEQVMAVYIIGGGAVGSARLGTGGGGGTGADFVLNFVLTQAQVQAQVVAEVLLAEEMEVESDPQSLAGLLLQVQAPALAEVLMKAPVEAVVDVLAQAVAEVLADALVKVLVQAVAEVLVAAVAET